MENQIIHDSEAGRFNMTVDGITAHVAYQIKGRDFDIRHTIVPEAIGGRGIASKLVKAAYDYALEQGLTPVATCAYAVVWLERHPEYGGRVSEECADGACAL